MKMKNLRVNMKNWKRLKLWIDPTNRGLRTWFLELLLMTCLCNTDLPIDEITEAE